MEIRIMDLKLWQVEEQFRYRYLLIVERYERSLKQDLIHVANQSHGAKIEMENLIHQFADFIDSNHIGFNKCRFLINCKGGL